MLDKANILSACSAPPFPLAFGLSSRPWASGVGVALGLAVSLSPGAVEGEVPQSAGADKSQYTLFHPTPRELMRALTTDRPDKTEAATSVDAGHLQVEMDLVTYTRDRYNPAHENVLAESWSAGPISFKLGLLNNVDAQLVVEPYQWVRVADRTQQPAATERRSGFGDVTVRSKINLMGNDGGKVAFALLPFVKLPANQDGLGNHSVEGGLILPLEWELGAGLEAAMNTGFGIARDEAGGGHHPEFINSLTLGRDLMGPLSGYAEFWSLVSAEENSDWVGSVDLGFNYLLTPDLKLDFGVNIGVTRAADDWNPFLGITWRY